MNILSVTGFSNDLVIDALKEKLKGLDPLEALKLKDNQIIEAKVLKVFSQSQAQLLIGGQKLTATTQMPLSENETLVLKVARSEGKQILRRVETSSPPVSQQPEGLSEMRALGREGPYAQISDILNTSIPGEVAEPMVSEDILPDLSFNKDMAPLPKDLIKSPSGEQIKTPQSLRLEIEKPLDKGMTLSPKDLIKSPSGEQIKTPQPLSPEIEKILDKGMAPSVKDLITPPPGEQIKTPQPLNPGIEKILDKGMAPSPQELIEPPSVEQIKTPQQSGSGIEKTISSEKDIITAFTNNPKIPFELKLALVVSIKPADTSPNLEKPITALTQELVDVLSPQPDAPQSGKASLTLEPMQSNLEQTGKRMLEALPPEEKNMARQFLESKSLTWESKMAHVLLAGDTKAPSEAVSTLRNSLITIAKENPGYDTAKVMTAHDDGTRRSMVENNPNVKGFEESVPPLDVTAKNSSAPADTLTSSDAPVILKKQTDGMPTQDVKTDVLPGAKPNVALPQSVEPSEVMLANPDKKSALPLSVEENPALVYGKEAISDKAAVTRPLPLTPSFRNDAVATSEPPQSAIIKRDLENIFSRLETSLEKQVGLFDSESTQTMALVKKMKELVSSFTLRSEQTFDESTVKNLVRDSGLMWESKLKDLAVGLPEKKSVLTQEQTVKLIENDMKALALKGAGLEDGVKHSVSETLKTFTESIEKMQVLNSQSSDDSGKYLLPLPYVHEGNIRFGQLLIDLDNKKTKEGEGKDRIIRVAFILDMSRLGPIQAGVSLYKKSLSGEFLVGNAEVKTMVDEALPGLVDELALKGYSVKKMECRLTDPATLADTNLVDKLISPVNGAVNIRI